MPTKKKKTTTRKKRIERFPYPNANAELGELIHERADFIADSRDASLNKLAFTILRNANAELDVLIRG